MNIIVTGAAGVIGNNLVLHMLEKHPDDSIVNLDKPESLITHIGDRKGHDMRFAIAPAIIYAELKCLPENRFTDGIQKNIQRYLSNRSWWKTIVSGEYQPYYEKMDGNR